MCFFRFKRCNFAWDLIQSSTKWLFYTKAGHHRLSLNSIILCKLRQFFRKTELIKQNFAFQTKTFINYRAYKTNKTLHPNTCNCSTLILCLQADAYSIAPPPPHLFALVSSFLTGEERGKARDIYAANCKIRSV